MSVSLQIQRLRQSVQSRGLMTTVRRFIPGLYRLVVPRPQPIHPFDLQHGVDTSGLIWRYKLSSGHAHDDHNIAYWGTAPSAFHGVIQRWQQTLDSTPYAIKDYSFIDIGCGKGRAVMMASDLPFRRVSGVELIPSLAAIAQSNLAKWKSSPHACNNIEVLNADALTVDIPDVPTLIYLFNSFGAPLVKLLLDRFQALAVSRSSPIDIIYTHPEQAAIVEAVPGIALLHVDKVTYAPEDAAVDAFKATFLDFRVYRLPGVRATAP